MKKKKVLFIDRDGTLVVEPPEDYQLDSLEKLEFIPGVFRNLYNIRNLLDFELVMVTNQDGLGTDSFPETTFHPAHNKMLRLSKTKASRSRQFTSIARSRKTMRPHRKPGTALLQKYFYRRIRFAQFVCHRRPADRCGTS